MSTAEAIARALLGLLSFIVLIVYLRGRRLREDQTETTTQRAPPELEKAKTTIRYFPPEHTAATEEQLDWPRGANSTEAQQAALLRELAEHLHGWRTAEQKRGRLTA